MKFKNRTYLKNVYEDLKEKEGNSDDRSVVLNAIIKDKDHEVLKGIFTKQKITFISSIFIGCSCIITGIATASNNHFGVGAVLGIGAIISAITAATSKSNMNELEPLVDRSAGELESLNEDVECIVKRNGLKEKKEVVEKATQLEEHSL